MYPNGNNQIGAYGSPYVTPYTYAPPPQPRQDMYRVQIDNLQQQLDTLRSMVPQPAQQPIQSQSVNQPENLSVSLIPIKTEDEAYNWSVEVGKSQMFMTEDENTICIKEVHPNNQFEFSVYERRDPVEKPKAAEYVRRDELKDLDQYVRKDQLKDYVVSIMTGKEAEK